MAPTNGKSNVCQLREISETEITRKQLPLLVGASTVKHQKHDFWINFAVHLHLDNN
jgi:hypothetical protein